MHLYPEYVYSGINVKVSASELIGVRCDDEGFRKQNEGWLEYGSSISIATSHT